MDSLKDDGCDKRDLPLQSAIEIQEALKPLGYVVKDFKDERREGGFVTLRLDSGGKGLPWHKPIRCA